VALRRLKPGDRPTRPRPPRPLRTRPSSWRPLPIALTVQVLPPTPPVGS